MSVCSNVVWNPPSEKVKGMEKGDKVVCVQEGHFHHLRVGEIVSVDRDLKNIFQYKVVFVIQRPKLTSNYEAWLFPNMVQNYKEWNRNKRLEEFGI